MLIEVKIEESNAVRIRKERYSYVEFEQLSEELRPENSVTYLLVQDKKVLYQGKYQCVSGLSFHESIHYSIEQMIQAGTLKQRKGQKLLELLDQELAFPGGTQPSSTSVSFTPSSEKKNKKYFSLNLDSLQSFFKIHWKKIGIGGSIFFLLFIGILWSSTQKIKTNPIDSYQTLVDKKEYTVALKEYPQKEEVLVKQLYQEKNKKELSKLSKEGKSTLAFFYLLFLEHQWKKITEMTDLPVNEETQGMLGFAYLKQGKIEEAELINQEIKSKVLDEQIQLAKKEEAYQAIHEKDVKKAEQINQEIHDEGLTEDLSVAKSIVNLLEKYQKDKENTTLSESEHKEAEENYKLWEEKLQQLGGVSNDESNNEQ